MDKQSDRLILALERACKLLADSEESPWSSMSPAAICSDLKRVADAVRSGSRWDHVDLLGHFAPTSTVQETAIWNGWHDEYMEVCTVVDDAVARARADAPTQPGDLHRGAT